MTAGIAPLLLRFDPRVIAGCRAGGNFKKIKKSLEKMLPGFP
jgi:pyruvate/2-oxoglutarate dehydrogenase complex dihydrolipoamide acyltransferase (E2) component